MYQANYKYICSTCTTIYHTYTWICRVLLERSIDLVFFFVRRRPQWQMMFNEKWCHTCNKLIQPLGLVISINIVHTLFIVDEEKKSFFFFFINRFWIITGTIRKYLLWVTLSEEVLYPCDLLSLMHNSTVCINHSCLIWECILTVVEYDGYLPWRQGIHIHTHTTVWGR